MKKIIFKNSIMKNYYKLTILYLENNNYANNLTIRDMEEKLSTSIEEYIKAGYIKIINEELYKFSGENICLDDFEHNTHGFTKIESENECDTTKEYLVNKQESLILINLDDLIELTNVIKKHKNGAFFIDITNDIINETDYIINNFNLNKNELFFIKNEILSVNDILDKIIEHGIESITEIDLQILKSNI
jgi:hypothetical protein